MSIHLSFDWTLPEEIFGEDFGEDDLHALIKQIVAISLFRDGRVSSGLAAEMLGISRGEFLQLLYDKGVSYFDLDENELEAEWAAVERLGQGLRPKPTT